MGLLTHPENTLRVCAWCADQGTGDRRILVLWLARRLFLSPYDLTPTYKLVHNKFSVKYYLNLVLVDEEDRRYFKQQEIQLYRQTDTGAAEGAKDITQVEHWPMSTNFQKGRVQKGLLPHIVAASEEALT